MPSRSTLGKPPDDGVIIDSIPENKSYMTGIAEDGRRLYRFGPFEVDAVSGELRKYNTRVRLREQPFQILLLLVQRPGEVVLREEIRRVLWGANTTVDFEHGINTSVNRLRDALGETAAEPRHIETVGRRGYRFLGEVEVAPLPEARRRTSKRVLWPWMAVAAVALAGFVSMPGWRANRGLEPATPLTTYPGVAWQPSFSPDGAKIAFSWGGDQQQNVDLWVKQAGSGAPQRLTTHAAEDLYPAWSPDGRHIAFLRSSEPGTGSVMLVSSAGGPEREVFHLGPRPGPGVVGSPVPLNWTPDGESLVVAARENAGQPGAIWLVSIVAGPRRRLTSPGEAGVADSNPAISPDGALLAFSRGRAGQYADRLFFLSLSRGYVPSGEPRRVAAQGGLVSGIAWVNAREIIYSAGGGAAAHLWRVKASGDLAPVRLHFCEDALNPAVATPKSRLAYAGRTFDSEIWRLNLRTGERQPLIVSRGTQQSPQYSPDGHRIAFASTRSGEQEIWVCSAEGTDCQQLTSLRGPHSGAPHWSPDGRALVFDSRLDGPSQIYRMGADGGAPVRLTSGDQDSFTPSWSRDGRWIYFASDRSGDIEIWRMPAEGGEAVRLSSGGGFWPEEAPGGAGLYYVKPGQPGLYRMPPGGGREIRVLPSLEARNAWALGANGLYFLPLAGTNPASLSLVAFPTAGQTQPLSFLNYGAASPARVFALGRDAVPQLGMCVSPSGEYVLGSRFRVRADIMLVENFR